jgi:hypothetical protein
LNTQKKQKKTGKTRSRAVARDRGADSFAAAFTAVLLLLYCCCCFPAAALLMQGKFAGK